MKILILRDKHGKLCELQLRSTSNVDTNREVSWRIDTGRRVLALNGRLHAVTRKLWMFGNIDQGAVYACESQEMFLLLTELMGPCDQEPEIAQAKRPKILVREHPIWPQIVAGIAHVTLVVFFGLLKVIGILILLPLIIRMFSKPK